MPLRFDALIAKLKRSTRKTPKLSIVSSLPAGEKPVPREVKSNAPGLAISDTSRELKRRKVG